MNQFRVEKGVSGEGGSNFLNSIDPNKHLISNEMLIDPVKRVRYAGAIRVNEQGEPIASCKWTVRVWETTGWSWRLQENYRSFLQKCREYSQINGEILKDVTMRPVGLGNTGSWLIMPKNLPGHWFGYLIRHLYLIGALLGEDQRTNTLEAHV